MVLANNWFTEASKESGVAFSLHLHDKVHEEKTPYQTIAVYKTQTFGYLMTIDGLVMLTSRDNFLYHEMLSHPAIFSHPAPKHVLIIGGGDCGTLRECLRHRELVSVEQVEIDERVTRLAERYFPELTEANDDPRASLHFVDGIRWIEEATEARYDLIIVDSTDPVGPAKGLFTEAFYRHCQRCLGEQGILVQQSESPLLHLSLIAQMRAAMTAAGFSFVRTLQFPQPVYPSGWWSATLAGKGNELTSCREQALQQCTFPLQYYNVDIHHASFALPNFVRQYFAQQTTKED